METNANKLIKVISINQKKRLRTVILSLIIFNCLLATALIYLYVSIPNISVAVISLVLFLVCMWRSVATYVQAKTDTKFELYKNKLIIKSFLFSGEIELSTIYSVQPKRSLIDILFRRNASYIILSSKKEDHREKIVLSYIDEDIYKLCDEILGLAIKAREKFEKKENKKKERKNETD